MGEKEEITIADFDYEDLVCGVACDISDESCAQARAMMMKRLILDIGVCPKCGHYLTDLVPCECGFSLTEN